MKGMFMFSDLLDFGLERSALKALGFYIFYLVTFMVFGVVITLCSYSLFSPSKRPVRQNDRFAYR